MKETEAEFQGWVIATARRLGYRVAHFNPAPTRSGGWATAVGADGAGFPDLVLVKNYPPFGRGPIFAELKSDRGSLSPKQAVWQYALEHAGVEFYVWKPKDRDKIVAVLKSAPSRD